MKIVGIIPARIESTRYYGKPLKEICGMPMIGHVYHRSNLCDLLSDVYVATCNNEIYNYVSSINGKVVMTANSHERASDRVAEALVNIEKDLQEKIDIVVMIQGDEPMIFPEMISDGIEPLIKNKKLAVTNLMSVINSKSEWVDPNEVKVVVDNQNFAMYFSREPIPSDKKYDGKIVAFKQVCIISFKRDILLQYCNMKPTPLEIIESVDMNRLLENGIKIKMVPTDQSTFAVDTEKDLKHVGNLMKNDKLMKTYCSGS